MAKNDFKAFATDRNANVMSQEEWEALPALLSGFTAGKASSAQVNKVIRQASFIAAALAQFVSDKTQRDVLDNGDLPGFVELLGSGFAVEYLSRKNPFGDIKSDGTVKTALENLGLSDSTGTVGRLINCQLFTSGGFYTPSPGMKFFLAHMIGGGGASGGTPATSSSQTGGVAAGNSGAYAYIKAYASDIGAGKAVSVGAGGKSQVNGAGFAGGTTAIADIADVTGGYGSGPGSVGATIAVAQPSYDKPVINKYNKTEVLAFSLGSQAWNFLQVATGSGTGWISPASPFPGGERGRGGSGIFVNASSAAQAGLAGNDGAILIMEYA
ncbi:TPA: hypothetical protein RHZ01_003402 [Escherichia coli]|nr:hypothetical protein [Escherichia coli]HCO8043689.1 hypothetical protein [Escherichia coli]HDV2538818.1 hypothetical protein [Escherichia coli]HDV2562049.1 hypothetical protein [Escherichia coli]HDV2799253.1 hypothetical protein [Escherichia coli]